MHHAGEHGKRAASLPKSAHSPLPPDGLLHEVDELLLAVHVALVVDVARVRLDRVAGDREPLHDGLPAVAAREQLEDLAFARREAALLREERERRGGTRPRIGTRQRLALLGGRRGHDLAEERAEAEARKADPYEREEHEHEHGARDEDRIDMAPVLRGERALGDREPHRREAARYREAEGDARERPRGVPRGDAREGGEHERVEALRPDLDDRRGEPLGDGTADDFLYTPPRPYAA